VINPLMMKGQELGALTQGLGHTLSEELVWEGGEPLVTSLVDYRVPRFSDVPASLTVVAVEDGNGPGPFGAKGGGEGAIIPVASAVSAALEQALGIRLRRLPATPQALWEAMEEARASAPGPAEDGS
jgi:CO/xanthine dehydrogenase Mo-binding subunit